MKLYKKITAFLAQRHKDAAPPRPDLLRTWVVAELATRFDLEGRYPSPSGVDPDAMSYFNGLEKYFQDLYEAGAAYQQEYDDVRDMSESASRLPLPLDRLQEIEEPKLPPKPPPPPPG